MKATFKAISEKRYQSATGKKPRGFGYWGFEITFPDGTREVIWAPAGTYAVAKAWAVKEATARGALYVEVAR